MSTDTREAVDAAIRAHAADEWDGILIADWTVVAGGIGSTDNDLGIGMLSSRDPMPGYIVKGLLVEALDGLRDGDYDDED